MKRFDRAFQLAASVGLILVVLPLALPYSTRASVVLQDFMHVPVFALVAIAVLRTVQVHRSGSALPPGKQYLVALAVAAGIGAASEIAQIPGPRDASIQDWVVDVASATTALALMRQQETRGPETARGRRALAVTSIAGSLFLLAPLLETAVAYGYRYRQLPDLVRFHGVVLDTIDSYFMVDAPLHPAFRNLPDRWRGADDPVSVKVFLPRTRWPGFHIDEPYPDWSTYSTLFLDLTNPGDRELEMTLRIHDAIHDNEHTDRFNWRILLPPGTRKTFRVPLSSIRNAPRGRQMDMERIAGLLLFRSGPEREDEVYITRIALER